MIRPDYYENFKCIADRCQHTCCAGWEIDIDEESLERYQKIDGDIGRKLKENIVLDEDPHFQLGEGERCPFLNEQNLCEIIIECGEDKLCQICSDHPRFRNELNNVEEIGVGLCCEAAADLILRKEEKTVLIGCEEVEEFTDLLEEEIYIARQKAMNIIQDRTISMDERAVRLLDDFQVQIPEMSAEEWIAFYLSLERMDEEWTEVLRNMENIETTEKNEVKHLEVPFEQFFVYLLYRHLPQTQDYIDLKAQIGYCYVNYKLLQSLCSLQDCNLEKMIDLARMFSSEIEYSEENTDEILNLLWEENEE